VGITTYKGGLGWTTANADNTSNLRDYDFNKCIFKSGISLTYVNPSCKQYCYLKSMKQTFAIENKHNPFILMLYISFSIRGQYVLLFAFRT
jgi:hypothetical protein